MAKPSTRLPLRAVLAAVGCNLLFGSAVPAIKLGYALFEIHSDPFAKLLFAGVRFFASGVAVFAVAAVRRRGFPAVARGNRWNVVALALVYTFLQYLFNYIGLSNTSGASASIVTASSVFLSVTLAHFLDPDDRMTPRKALGVAAGFGGVVLAALTGAPLGRLSLFGEGFILLSAACFASGSLLARRASRRADSFTTTAYNLLLGGALLTAVGLCGLREPPVIRPAGVAVFCYLVFVSAFGFTLWSLLVQRYPIGSLSVTNFVIPVSGTLLSGPVLGEHVLRWPYFAALALVSTGIVLVNLRPARGSDPGPQCGK